MAKVTIVNTKQEFESVSSNTILDDALLAGIKLEHGCKDGACGSCEAQLLEGSVSEVKFGSDVIVQDSNTNPKILLCQSKALSDIVIEAKTKVDYIQFPIKLQEIVKTDDMAILTFKLPTSIKFNYKAGQYIDFTIDGKNRSYSLASSPTQTGLLEVHVRFHAEGVFSNYVWNKLDVNNVLRVIGPKGNFYLNENSHKKIMLVATGTGFAPLKGILKYMQDSNLVDREVTLILGNRHLHDFYNLEYIDALADSNIHVQVVKLLSRDNVAGYLNGYVTTYIENNYSNLADYEIYACGNINMIKDVYKLAINKNLVKDRFYSDAFTPA